MIVNRSSLTLCWATDLHLNHASPAQLATFQREVCQTAPDALIITGDFSESIHLEASLEWLASWTPAPIFFCLGNHDFYYDSIQRTRDRCEAFSARHPELIYLTRHAPIALGPDIGLLGHDGWADGRSPSYERSLVTMHDARLIGDFEGLDKRQRWDVMMTLADESAQWLRDTLPPALERWTRLYLATHVPPLRQACWYQGGISDDHWAPHFVNRVFGETLLEIMRDYPQHDVTVLCGHTHGEGLTLPLPNVRIYTGRAEYGSPCVARCFRHGMLDTPSPSPHTRKTNSFSDISSR